MCGSESAIEHIWCVGVWCVCECVLVRDVSVVGVW